MDFIIWGFSTKWAGLKFYGPGPNLNGLLRWPALINIVIANKILGLFGHLFWNQDSCFCKKKKQNTISSNVNK